MKEEREANDSRRRRHIIGPLDLQKKLSQGRDKHENENLVAHALPHDIWFHVEDMSSAHVYLRPPASLYPPAAATSSPKPGKGGDAAAAPAPSPNGRNEAVAAAAAAPLPARAWHDIPQRVLSDCCQLVKHNSISGGKASAVNIVYTPWSNLKKTDRMDIGQVGFHDNSPSAIRLEKNVKTDREAVKRIEKTRREVAKPDLAGEREAFDLEVIRARKAAAAVRKAEEKAAAAAAAAAKEARSYDKLLSSEAMKTPAEVAAKYESAAAFEDDFM